MRTTGQLIIVALLVALGYFGWENRESIPFLSDKAETAGVKKRTARAVPVIATKVQMLDLKQTVTAVGTLQANRSVDITAKVTAKVEKLAFEDGQAVNAADELVSLDDTEARAEVAESVAELANSRKLYERSRKLLKSGNTPKARVDLLLSEMQVAEAKVQADRARLNDYVIRAPFSGVVGFRDISIGALVRPGELITTLDDITQLKLDFDLPEKHLAQVVQGQSFITQSVAYEDKVFEGNVSSISTRVDPVTRVVRVRGLINNDNRILKPGMFLSVSLQTGMQENAIMIPEHAVTVSAAGHFAFVVENDLAQRKALTVGQRKQGWVQVLSGIDRDAFVIIEGLQKIRDGGPVKMTVEDNMQAADKGGEATQ
jgi:membrane fusion protein (multidrug efflux system)